MTTKHQIARQAASEINGGASAYLVVLGVLETAAVKVNQLEWNKYDEAIGFDCKYMVYQTGENWNCVKYPNGDSHYRLAEGVSEDNARATAQADYEARILSAIEPCQ